MLKLHIRQDARVEGSYPIRLTLKRDGQPDLEAEASIEFGLTEQEQNDLQWYLEDYLQHGGEDEAVIVQGAIQIFKRLGEKAAEAVVEWNLGNAYKNLSKIRNFDAAEAAYRRSLDLLEPHDAWGRSKCIAQIGVLYSEKLRQALQRDESPDILSNYAQVAEGHYITALGLCPAEASNELSAIQQGLGNLYLISGFIDSAREQFELMAQLQESMGDRLRAGAARFSIALTYFKAAATEQDVSQQRTDLERSRGYVEAALRDFDFYGEHALAQIQAATNLLGLINRQLASLA